MRRFSPALGFVTLTVCFLFSPRLSAQDGSLPQLIKRVKPSVVAVITYDVKGKVLTTGSGFFVRPGQVVTNIHVIEGATRAEVRTFEAKAHTYAVDGVVGADEEGDIALLQVNAPAERNRPLEISPSLPDEGERIFVIGNPLRLEGSVADGIVSAIREVPNLGSVVQITAPISPGNSGSPLFNDRGQVIGVVTIKVANAQNINLALGSKRVMELQQSKLRTFADFGNARDQTHPRAQALGEWWYRNGLSAMWLGNYDTALDAFERAAGQDPGRAETWIQVGYCQVKQGKNAEAVKAYEKALRLRPNSCEAYNKLGDAYFFAGNYQAAITAYRQAASLRPEAGESFYNLALAYLELGDRAEAEAQGEILKKLDAGLYRKLVDELAK
jgi:tetratricopeptide (TPR) repeat protein